MNLADIQTLFAANLDGPSDPSRESAFVQLLSLGGDADAAKRIEVYRNSAKAARMSALKEIYPVCLAILGERCFKGLTRDFIYEHPSLQPDLNVYGEQFPRQLKQALDLPGFAGMEYLPDLACLEWLWHGLYYAADDAVFNPQAFATDAAQDADNIRFRLSASLQLVYSPWPIAELWRRHRQQEGLENIEPSEGDYLVLWRQALDCRMEAVDESLFHLLEGVSKQLSVGEMANAGLAVERLGELLPEGWIVGHQLLVIED